MPLFKRSNSLFKKQLPVLLVLCFICSAQSKRFSTSYLSLELPDNWKCLSEGANWICHNKLNRKLAREAVIILTAKEKSSKDSVSDYIVHLKNRKTHTTKKGKTISSKVFHSKQRMIKNHPWADGFHLESEIKNYYTRYLGSTKKGLAALVTYSAHKTLWKKYAADFNKSIDSLQLLNVEQALRSIRAARGKKGKGGGIRDYLDALIGDGDIEGLDDGEEGFIGRHKDKIIGGGAGAVAVGTLLYRFLRRRQESAPSGIASRRRRRKR